MSFYSRYRPQKVHELDLDSVRQSLQTLLDSGSFSHAYLFAGPKGTGKTSSARILAKVLNCETNTDAVVKKTALNEPCGVCRHCKGVVQGSSLSVIEMDAASNRGIDDIRELKQRIALSPAEGTFVIYVIDEVHMLTTEAFNALLKTLEEPPAHAIFVLCTTEGHKLPGTIVSRCTEIQFSKASEKEVITSLNKAVAGEKLMISDEALQLIAKRSDGSFRDGMKLLEQAAQSGKNITLETVHHVTGMSGMYAVDSLFTALMSNNVEMCFEEIKNREGLGVDFSLFTKRMVEEAREKLISLIQVGGDPVEIERYRELTDLLADAALKVKGSVITQLPLELACAQWCLEHHHQPTKKFEATITHEEKIPVSKQQSHTTLSQKKAVKANYSNPKDVVKAPEVIPGKTVALNEVEQYWPKILTAIRPHNHSLEALLKASRPVSLNHDSLTIEVFYTFHKEQLEQERHRKLLETCMAEVLHAVLKLKFVLGKKAERVKSPSPKMDANVTGKVEDEQLAQMAEEIFT